MSYIMSWPHPFLCAWNSTTCFYFLPLQWTKAMANSASKKPHQVIGMEVKLKLVKHYTCERPVIVSVHQLGICHPTIALFLKIKNKVTVIEHKTNKNSTRACVKHREMSKGKYSVSVSATGQSRLKWKVCLQCWNKMMHIPWHWIYYLKVKLTILILWHENPEVLGVLQSWLWWKITCQCKKPI